MVGKVEEAAVDLALWVVVQEKEGKVEQVQHLKRPLHRNIFMAVQVTVMEIQTLILIPLEMLKPLPNGIISSKLQDGISQ